MKWLLAIISILFPVSASADASTLLYQCSFNWRQATYFLPDGTVSKDGTEPLREARTPFSVRVMRMQKDQEEFFVFAYGNGDELIAYDVSDLSIRNRAKSFLEGASLLTIYDKEPELFTKGKPKPLPNTLVAVMSQHGNGTAGPRVWGEYGTCLVIK
jgi:hypothetical protein